ncbi:hypothetical protein [Helicobacter macacae]|uniref:Uncharacterized protein n=1 Tax=Helicobacter macacae MIT 99-5501 TaxID=1357400 RepID=V8C827_9HELI|nr:hypothetical protein [Helicobacter macacae]ETD23227.1 hypothetical protein HMPREF2086_01026 [Helicobacter macacae MIT 99-5501]
MQKFHLNERERESSSRLISSPSIASEHNVSSPSRSTSGARGWVDTTSALQVNLTTANSANISVTNNTNANVSVIASERSWRGNPQKDIDYHENLCGFSCNDGTMDCHDLTSSSLAMTNKSVDCHANANAFARKTRQSRSFFSNDESFYAFSNAKDTHPQTPSAKEGAFKKPSYPHLCEKVSLAILATISTASINMLIALESTKLCTKSIISSRTDFCKQSSAGYLADFAPSSAIDFANPTK